jgi:hypothetical protein
MITFSNTIITNRTFLNLNLVKTILFSQECTSNSGKISEVCHIVFYADSVVHIVTDCTDVSEYLMYDGSLFPVIKDKTLFNNLTDLSLTENE